MIPTLVHGLQPRITPHHMGVIIAILLVSLFRPTDSQLLPCRDDEITFALTQCDDANGQWRVPIPYNKSINCIPKGKPPLRIQNCETSCPAGFSYNLANLNCTQCAPGTYSVGNSQTYDEWSVLPPGFHSQSSGFGGLEAGSSADQAAKGTCGPKTWLPRGDFISLEETEGCSSALTLQVDIVQNGGYVEFEYQFPDSSTMFTFSANSHECRSTVTGSDATVDTLRLVPDHTVRSSWLAAKLDLPRGKFTLMWLGISMINMRGSSYNPVRIRRVQVVGVKYSKSCNECPAGTFSRAGASRCEDCPLNQVSTRKGSGICIVCPDHQYALPGFLQCFDRIPCTTSDYIRRVGPCSADYQNADITYEWISPKICSDAGVVLPPASQIPCPRCNPGFYRHNVSTCSACDPGKFLNANGICAACDGGTSPAYKYEITNWTYLPNNIDAFCWNNSALGCANDGGWQLNGDSITTGYGHEDDVLLVMQMFTGGFRKVIQQKYFGQLSFDFELVCKSPQCQLKLMVEETDSYSSYPVKTWTGSQPRERFEYLVPQNASLGFTWIFVKTGEQSSQATTKPRLFGNDVLRIFSINLTNTVEGGADACEPCSGSDATCLKCGPHEIWSTEFKKCLACPPNSIVSEVDGTCFSCGANLIASGKQCVSNCHVSLQNGEKHYDLTPLKGTHQTSTQHFFQSSGEEYFHTYNISFCEDTPATCATTFRRGALSAKSQVSGFVCRSTQLMASGKGPNATTAIQPFSSGKEIVEITDELPKEVITAQKLFSEVVPEFSSSVAPDFFYRFRTLTTALANCPSGRSTVITMRCSKNTTSLHDIRVPSDCSDGTCDGCIHRLMWLTPFACPICGPDDYTVVRGECTSSLQSIYYHSKPHCHETNTSSALVKQVPCRAVPFSVQVLIITLVVSGAALAVTVLILYKNANKYKHRYMKLVQDASGVIHLQLPESCVDDHELDDPNDHENGDDDADSQGKDFNVEFRTPSKTVYAKVKKAVTKKKDLRKHGAGGGAHLIGSFRESEENELLVD
ncbi:hypothetical protein BV898_01938 [Hypsibius exemplaris]|uniref:MRH domain-containing protein n=1 Tax=Hypsibius exemplaris TaxID=2072580 RepID=A0A1W0XAH7_HYPEX|nr:hypothetical protein BV898_01938 [Hypsibius exemplaris]